jgi:hypothetical protein
MLALSRRTYKLILSSHRRATALETSLGEGHPTGSTHTVIVLRCACHVTLCGTDHNCTCKDLGKSSSQICVITPKGLVNLDFSRISNKTQFYIITRQCEI